MSILLPPLFTTIRVNKLIDPEKKNIEKEIKSHLQQVYKEHQLHVEPTVYRHAILEDVCVIPSVRRSVKPNGKVVLVDQLCGMAILRGADVFVPGVLCMPKGLKKKDDVAVYVHVSGKCLKGMLKFEGEKMFVGNATALVSRDDIFKSKIQKGAALKMKETPFFAPCLDNVLPDKIFMQV
uniref:Putative methyltransferase NSUN6 n=1 Tax=Phallusia mammillata TaxID=59560 RepID=A0A6F9DMV5_9ASCI|nr:putative methyltransferase NSUN6 [Phallusia mammillata]